jgi:hypothetical protein
VRDSSLPSLVDALRLALKSLGSTHENITSSARLAEIESILKTADIPPAALLAEAALAAAKPEAVGVASDRESLQYLVAQGRNTGTLKFSAKGALVLDPLTVEEAIVAANAAIKVVHDVSSAYDVSLFEILGLRNLSSFVGEVFKDQLARLMAGTVLSNPHQDGYPDLLALTPEAKQSLKALEAQGLLSSKGHFSPFPYGGLEIKATCGDTPAARVRAKPKIGESRLEVVTGLVWKAHHRDTNYLVGLVWDFVDNIPTVVAVFYRNDLTIEDWGKTVAPKEGSRTTSVSVMARQGVQKMAAGWLVLPSDRDTSVRILRAMKSPLPPQPPVL